MNLNQNSTVSSAKVKKEWSYTSTTPYVFMEWFTLNLNQMPNDEPLVVYGFWVCIAQFIALFQKLQLLFWCVKVPYEKLI
jgi:hypothetical protein